MSIINPAPFLAALHAVFQNGPAAIALTEEELILLANNEIAPAEQLCYQAYCHFKEFELLGQATDSGPDTAAYLAVYKLLKTQIAKHKLAMLKEVGEAKPNWRRYCWLLQKHEKAHATAKKPKPTKAASTPIATAASAPTPEETPMEVSQEAKPPVAKTNFQKRKRKISSRYSARPTLQQPVTLRTEDQDAVKKPVNPLLLQYMQRYMRR